MWLCVQGLEVCEVLGSEHAYGYRNKLTPHHDKPKQVHAPTLRPLDRHHAVHPYTLGLRERPHCQIHPLR